MMKRIYIGLILLTFLGCQSPIERFDCQKVDFIEVYFVPFDISTPVGVTQEHIKKDLHKKKIDDNGKIKKACENIPLLKEVKGVGFNHTKVHFRADFFQGEKEVLTILSDGISFKIGRRIYELDSSLLSMLIDDYNY